MRRGALREHFKSTPSADKGPERYFSYDAFQTFLTGSLGLDANKVKAVGSELFHLKEPPAIAEFLVNNFGVDQSVAPEFADLILLEEQTAFLKGPDIQLGDLFFRKNFHRFQVAKTPETIYRIFEEHRPSFSREQLVRMTEATAAVFRLPRTRLWEHALKSTLRELPGMSEDDLSAEAWQVLGEQKAKDPVEAFGSLGEEFLSKIGDQEIIERPKPGGTVDTLLDRLDDEQLEELVAKARHRKVGRPEFGRGESKKLSDRKTMPTRFPGDRSSQSPDDFHDAPTQPKGPLEGTR